MRIVLLSALVLTLLLPARPAMAQDLPAICADGKYVSAMHPQFRGDKGDNCPICGMELQPDPICFPDENTENTKSAQNNNNKALSTGTQISPVYRQALGVKTQTVQTHTFGQNIRAFGAVKPSTRHEYMFHMRAEGWVVDLKTSAIGDRVQKGDLLFTYYSPDLMNAQSDYLIGSRIGNAKERLYLYGMDEQAIRDLKQAGKMMRETPFYAPTDGIITRLNVRKGSFVKEGELALTLQNYDTVWVEADVPVQKLSFLEKGQTARITIPETGKAYTGTIDTILPEADTNTRTATVRMVLSGEENLPKPGTYADVVFEGEITERLAVPAEAVLRGSNKNIVLLDKGNGYFTPVTVKTGITANSYTEILSGLSAGQRIVTTGQFMIDAESNLRGGTNAMQNHGDMQEMHHDK